MAADAATGGEMGYHKVTVKVTNVAETGKVTWTIDPDGTGGLDPTNVNGGSPIVQFQVGAALTASVTDGDVSETTKTPTGIRWQWYRSSSNTAMGTAIEDNANADHLQRDDRRRRYAPPSRGVLHRRHGT